MKKYSSLLTKNIFRFIAQHSLNMNNIKTKSSKKSTLVTTYLRIIKAEEEINEFKKTIEQDLIPYFDKDNKIIIDKNLKIIYHPFHDFVEVKHE